MTRRPAVLVSMCLLGIECRYDGRANGCGQLEALMALAELVPVCPEQLGGLPTPRTPSERLGSRVLTRDGADVTAAFRRGAAQVCRLTERFGARYALLKARSPSCGVGTIYDGSFSGALTAGDGVTAAALRLRGVQLFTEKQIDILIETLERDTHDTV